jgi:hypothetical protein
MAISTPCVPELCRTAGYAHAKRAHRISFCNKDKGVKPAAVLLDALQLGYVLP